MTRFLGRVPGVALVSVAQNGSPRRTCCEELGPKSAPGQSQAAQLGGRVLPVASLPMASCVHVHGGGRALGQATEEATVQPRETRGCSRLWQTSAEEAGAVCGPKGRTGSPVREV